MLCKIGFRCLERFKFTTWKYIFLWWGCFQNHSISLSSLYVLSDSFQLIFEKRLIYSLCIYYINSCYHFSCVYISFCCLITHKNYQLPWTDECHDFLMFLRIWRISWNLENLSRCTWKCNFLSDNKFFIV